MPKWWLIIPVSGNKCNLKLYIKMIAIMEQIVRQR